MLALVFVDVKMENVLGLEWEHGEVSWKLIDFDSSCLVDQPVRGSFSHWRPLESCADDSSSVATYLTPEVAIALRRREETADWDEDILGTQQLPGATEAMDAFSLGCMIVEMLVGGPFGFREEEYEDQLDFLCNSLPVELPEGVPLTLKRLLVNDRKNRLTVQQFRVFNQRTMLCHTTLSWLILMIPRIGDHFFNRW